MCLFVRFLLIFEKSLDDEEMLLEQLRHSQDLSNLHLPNSIIRTCALWNQGGAYMKGAEYGKNGFGQTKSKLWESIFKEEDALEENTEDPKNICYFVQVSSRWKTEWTPSVFFWSDFFSLEKN